VGELTLQEADLLANGYVAWDDKWKVFMPTHKALGEHVTGKLYMDWGELVHSCNKLTSRFVHD
jgi:hypothetical protein